VLLARLSQNQQLFCGYHTHERVIVFTTGIEKRKGRADVFSGFKALAPRGTSDFPTEKAILPGGA
jgi:hypothetical protein